MFADSFCDEYRAPAGLDSGGQMSDDDLTDDATIPFYSPNQPPDTAAGAEDGAGSTRGRDGTRGVMSDDKRRQRVRACVPGVFSDSVSRKRTPMGVPRREIAMHDTVAQIIRKWLGQFEGPVREMYIDNRGLVTTGTGNLLQSAREANTYQWERIAGGAASPPEVAAEFERVRSAETKRKIPGWAVMGGGNFIKSAMKLGIVTLRLTADSVDKMFQDKLNGLEATMKGTPGYEEYEDFPGDAQIGILSVGQRRRGLRRQTRSAPS